MLLRKLRLFSGKCSRTNIAPPVISPAAKKLYSVFETDRSTGATTPIVAKEGTKPIVAVAMDIPSSDKKIDCFLPNLSPIKPKIIAPRGRDISPRGSMA